ncbi:MAG: sporulation initiation inhibitor Soj [Candidatus Yanofskybacteria bacterium RIFCSPHIGHO2_02_FULL_38_22b]|uniref:Sporulation initiation inhibitor Soj n=1 Tax=Candidatus Yanofskybacteria bacterium RIFCSPHIGHO2_02_FULL_38_22b TaxID=1802673 RepID=A0A1F8EZA0_9BACT|nr:MAG: sporulation initiation inhibitor Soj [Candidatus Yanofskybacteria bacterium RIFCSPHIGHO2_01_FULL_39_44]OGN06197.1 MAG: sporulation initiation inhibitor Soj [Candidatus Yanofskybacteria bacterium RIFCSPHIGHO2_02_FULL_38_22b]OGN19617.1 MAG: sporulation initiation inhibitor Soj [Candidatus Yanofskybacteria bacterium RIFCSPLOWO2_01_FULL_39_28]
MARIITICNQKGGVGKTTTAINLASYLAALGKYVLLVDMDSQANATGGMGISVADEHHNVYHVIVNDQNPLPMIKKTSIFGFDILPANQALAGATVELVSMEEREYRLKNSLSPLRMNYDYILIDCPPSLGLLTINALTAGDYVIIPVQCEYYALEGLSQLLHTVNLIREGLNSDLQVLGVLLTMYDKRNQLNRHVLNEVHKNFPGRVFDAVISRTIDLAEAPSYGKPIIQFSPNSKAASEYRRLAEEVIKLTQ